MAYDEEKLFGDLKKTLIGLIRLYTCRHTDWQTQTHAKDVRGWATEQPALKENLNTNLSI